MRHAKPTVPKEPHPNHFASDADVVVSLSRDETALRIEKNGTREVTLAARDAILRKVNLLVRPSKGAPG